MSGTWTKLGPLGALVDIPDVQVSPTVGSARASSEQITLGGRRRVQYGPRGPLTWGVAHSWLTPAQVAFLTACAQGAVPGPLYLYTQDAARTNLLRPHLASPGAAGDTTLGPVSSSVVMVDGVGPMTGVVGGDSSAPWSETIPVLAGLSYTLSAWCAAASAMSAGSAIVQWRTVNAAGSQVSTGNVSVGPSGLSTARVSGTITPSSTAVGLQVRVVAVSAVTVTALRLTEGTPADDSWLPGVGAPQVAVDDPGITLQAVWDDQIRSDYTWTIREVG